MVDRRLIVHVLQKKVFIYENELINERNDCNVKQKIFIFLSTSCKLVGLLKQMKHVRAKRKHGRGGDISKHREGFNAPVFNVSVISLFASKRGISGFDNLYFKQRQH